MLRTGAVIARNVDPNKSTAHRVMFRSEHERVSVRQFADEKMVRFVGAFVRGGDWEVGLRIARNVTVDAGHGKLRDPAVSGRVSLAKMAEANSDLS